MLSRHDKIGNTADRHFEPLAGEKSVDLGRRLCRLLNFDFCILIFNFKNARRHFCKTNPIFLRPIMDFYIKNAEMEAK
jgi:hypothetical protein